MLTLRVVAEKIFPESNALAWPPNPVAARTIDMSLGRNRLLLLSPAVWPLAATLAALDTPTEGDGALEGIMP